MLPWETMPYSSRSCTWKSLAFLLFPLICVSQEPVQKPVSAPVQQKEGANSTNDKKLANEERKKQGVDVASISAIAGGVGAVVAGLLAGCFLLLSKRIDENNTIRTLAAQLALEQWKAEHTINLEKHHQDLRARGMPPTLNGYTLPYINPIIKEMGEAIEALKKTK